MVAGIMLSGIVAGLLGVAWALGSGLSLLLALACYPLAGIAGIALFLAVALRRTEIAEPDERLIPAHEHG